MLGDGGEALTCQTSYPISKAAVALVAGDINGDGALDLASSSGVDTLSVLLSN